MLIKKRVLVFLIISGAIINFFLVMAGVETPVPLSVSHPLAIFMILFLFRDLFQRIVYNVDKRTLIKDTKEITSLDENYFSTYCLGEIGGIRFGGRFLKIVVYSKGLVIKSLLIPPAPLKKEEILTTKVNNSLFFSSLVIIHNSPNISGKEIFLYMRKKKAQGLKQKLTE